MSDEGLTNKEKKRKTLEFLTTLSEEAVLMSDVKQTNPRSDKLVVTVYDLGPHPIYKCEDLSSVKPLTDKEKKRKTQEFLATLNED